jgi:hypothetical protein
LFKTDDTYSNGFKYSTYDSYFNGNSSFFSSSPSVNVGTGTWVTSGALGIAGSGFSYSAMIIGYLKLGISGEWKFKLICDSAILWIGANAISDFSDENNFLEADPSTRTVTNSIVIDNNIYYPIRIVFGSQSLSEDFYLGIMEPNGNAYRPIPQSFIFSPLPSDNWKLPLDPVILKPVSVLDNYTTTGFSYYIWDLESPNSENYYNNIAPRVALSANTLDLSSIISKVNCTAHESSVYMGYISVPISGDWGLKIYSDGYTRFWFGEKAFNNDIQDSLFTTENQGSTEKIFTITLVAGQYYPFRIHHGNHLLCDDLVLSLRRPTTFYWSTGGFTFSAPAKNDTRWSFPRSNVTQVQTCPQQDVLSQPGMTYYVFADIQNEGTPN